MAEWRKFWRAMLKTALISGGIVLALVIVLDPYDTLPFSPPFERYPATTNQRFSYPTIAADPAYDSMLTGTSTARLLYPPLLDEALGGRFVNLSMNSSRAYEQMRIIDLFLHHHPQMKHLVMGIDSVWCEQHVDRKFTERPFPPWLFDKNPWNDVFYLFNYSALEEAGRQLAQIAGFREPKYGRDGYRYFLPDPSEYDIAKVRQKLYKGKEPFVKPSEIPPDDNYESVLAEGRFPQLDYFRTIVASLPAETEVIAFFVPYHQSHIPPPGSLDQAVWNACKQEITEILSARENAHVVDFLIRSEITMSDENYWDPLHYTRETAEALVLALATAVETRRSDPAYYEYLGPASSSD